MHSPIAVVIFITFVGTVEQCVIAVVSAAMVVAITTGGSNFTVKVAERKLTLDNWEQPRKDCDGKKGDLHIFREIDLVVFEFSFQLGNNEEDLEAALSMTFEKPVE